MLRKSNKLFPAFCNLLLTALGQAVIPVSAQIIFSNGASVSILSGAVVHANGGVELNSTSDWTNNGNFTITRNSTLPKTGNLEILGTTQLSGDGQYTVEQDWVNDATFQAGNSSVELNGDLQQFITSNNGTSTTFHQLNLTGSGVANNRKKTLQGVDASVNASGQLNINDRELETQTNSFFVLNPVVSAVTNSITFGSEGFVSSIAPGVLSRETNSSAAYLFPTGSSAGTLRYRPVELVPTAATATTYTVRMINNDGTSDGFDLAVNDGVMCVLNDLYYHAILRPNGVTAADIRLFYVSAQDGSWSGMAHWRNANTQWNDMGTMTTGSAGAFNSVTRSTWNFSNPGEPYVLSELRPEAPVLNCPVVCENSSNNLFSLVGNSLTYQWTFPSNATLTSGQGNDSVYVDWTSGGGWVTAVAQGSIPGCVSIPDSCQVTVSPTPVASFISQADGEFGDKYTFTEQSSGANSWIWDFGDGSGSTVQNPTYQYSGSGDYIVTLIAFNSDGCSDTVFATVTAGEGIIIPNIFTPNGDNSNDEYFILASGLDEFKLSIYNRWGQLLFESEDINEKWDGTAPSGGRVPDGTYFYLLTAKSRNKDYSTQGTITITGSK